MSAATLLALALATAPFAHAGADAANRIAPPPHAPSFRHYGVLDGLPSDFANAIVQDREGYVWIGTRDGLARFDAQEFRTWRHDPNDAGSLAANDVSVLMPDARGRVWAGGEGSGLELYLPDTQTFAHWLHHPADRRSLPGNDVMGIAQDAHGSIWVGVYAGGLNRLLPDGRGFSHVRHRRNDPSSLLSDNVTALAAAGDGGLWVGTDAGLQHRDPRGHLTRVALGDDGAPVSVFQLNARDDGVDAATDAGLFHVDERGRARRIGPAAATYASLRDAHGEYWIARQDGIYLVAPDGGVRRYTPHAGVQGSLASAIALDFMQDRDGGVWCALMDGGVEYLPPRWRAFDAWRHLPEDAGSIADDRIRAIAAAPDGQLLVGGANGGLDVLDPHGGGVRHLADETGVRKSIIDALAVDGRGRFWIGHRYGLRLDDHGRVRDVDIGAGDARRAVHVLLAAADGTIYFAGIDDGVSRIDPAGLAVTPLRSPAPGSAVRQIQQLGEHPAGTIWSASLGGLARMTPGMDGFRFVPGVKPGLASAFAFAADGSLWVARSESLQHYALGGARAELLDSVDAARGWPAVTVRGLQVGEDGRVWATTPRGLVGYDAAKREVHFYGAADGLGNPEFVERSLLKASDGSLYAGSLGGVVAIRPGLLGADPSPPQLAPLQLRARRGGRLVGFDPRAAVALRWNDSEFSATARALSFADPQRIHYRFMLAGFDPGWVDTGTRDTREFSALRAGDYRLLASAAVGDGPWSRPGAAVAIHVADPPWATPWAWAAYALAILLSLLFAAWLLRRRLEQRHRFALVAQRQQLAEQASAAKTHFLASMAHEIRTPMTGVLGMTELLLGTQLDARQRGYADDIRRSGALLMRQVNDALDLARIEAGKLELAAAPFDPAALLHEVAALERALAEQKSLALDVAIAPDAPAAVRGDPLRVQQVLLNLTHNALKFTQAGGVRLHLQRAGDGLRFSISDDGPGMTPDECARLFRRFEQTASGKRHSGSGLGLAISHELVALMGGRIEVQSQPGSGSTFRVHLPLPECAQAPQRDAATTAGTGAARCDGRSLRVLVVEDDPVAAQVVAGLLQAQSHAATCAPHALAALTELQEADTAFDAILLDLDLPGMDGCTLARVLRARGYARPIVAVTASSTGDEEQRARSAGMDAFLRKPVLPEALCRTLEATRGIPLRTPRAEPGDRSATG